MITTNLNIVYYESNIGLGNHMFQYSLCRIIAEKNGYNFYIPNGKYLERSFPGIYLGNKDGEIQNYFNESPSQLYDENIFNIKDFTNINGYFQTEKYFKGNEDNVKSWFRIDIDKDTKSILEVYDVNKYCYIHIRGGDYKQSTNVLPKSYYDKSINLIKEKYSNLEFLIITDDVELANSYYPNIKSISNDIMVDFKLMYNSKYCILSNSTFSWWSSWLTEKEISIAPNNWLNYNNPELGFHPIDIKTDKFLYV